MISINSINMTLDESMRRFGTSSVQLSVSVSDQTPFHDRQPADSRERYGYRATLFGFGRDGSPDKEHASLIATFGTVVHIRQLVCTQFPRINCRFETKPRILEVQHFSDIGGDTSENKIVMLGHTAITVELDQLDVDPALPPFEFNGQVFPRPKADVLFCKVDVVDFKNRNAEVVSGESNAISDFYGENEPRTGTGDDRESPIISTAVRTERPLTDIETI